MGSHATLDMLFQTAGAPGDPPNLSHGSKWKEWLFRAGLDADVDSLAILGNILEEFMDLPLPDDPGAREVRTKMRAKVQTALEENGLRYFRFGRVLPQGQIPEAAERQLEQRNSSGPAKPSNVEDLLMVLLRGLRRAMHPLTHRRKGAQQLTFSNEYDVQDMLHALLRPWVSDIRPEEFTPSYAGSSTRMDFLLPAHGLVIELKFVRDRTHAKRIGDELIIDIEHYRVHPQCKTLWCVVYDPDNLLTNAEGLRTRAIARNRAGLCAASVTSYLGGFCQEEDVSMEEHDSARITEHFKALNDPRIQLKTQHKLIDIIVITICAVICGADDWTEIANYAKAKKEWFKKFLELPHGIPSHDTFGRVFSLLCPEEFEKCFLSWIHAVFDLTGSQTVAIDGKTLRRSYDHSSNKAAIHMVGAWATRNGISLGQRKTEAKSNEITAIPELLKLLEIKGCIVTIDAMGCQKEIARQIVDQGADYVLALKGNQGTIHDDVRLFFEYAQGKQFKDILHGSYEVTDGGHGRVEVRRYYTVSDIDWLEEKQKWKNLNLIGMVESERHIGEKITKETRYFISSLPNDTKRFAEAVRDHWRIENQLHWVLDIAFREDDSRVRDRNAATNLAILRRFALSLCKQEKTAKVGIKIKRKRAGWDNDYLLTLLNVG